jgi:2-polyprenyl-3-methyl-5-hydroxy-6-metoxy-1,4-benzoquinol methylase
MLKEVSEQFFQDKLLCPLCGKKRFKKFWAIRGYRLARCLNCDLVWDPFPPENLELIYDKNYFLNDNPKGGYTNYFEGMNINKKTFYERIKKINKKIINKERILDVGSALGDSLIEAKKLGWKELYGVELSKYAANKSKEKELNINVGTLYSAKYPSNYFDVVTIQDVIEHVKDPVKQLKEVYRILKPGGYIFIVTPDVDGFWSKILGHLWYHYKPGEHVIYFSQKTLNKILRDNNFNNIETRKTFHIMSLEYVFSRLRYYSPWFFETLTKFVKNNYLGRTSFKIYSGEIEAWGQK